MNATHRPLTDLVAGNLITLGYGRHGFVCWVEGPNEHSSSRFLGYLSSFDGEYHETTVRGETAEVWLEHPLIGANRAIEARAVSWADV